MTFKEKLVEVVKFLEDNPTCPKSDILCFIDGVFQGAIRNKQRELGRLEGYCDIFNIQPQQVVNESKKELENLSFEIVIEMLTNKLSNIEIEKAYNEIKNINSSKPEWYHQFMEEHCRNIFDALLIHTTH